MSQGTLEFTKWWEFRRATDFPQEPPCLVSDDLAGGGLEGAYLGRVADHARYQIAPAPFIPGQALVEHEMGHDIQRDVSDRTAHVDEWIKELFAVRGAPLPTAPDAHTKDAWTLAVEQACSMLPEAFGSGWGGYKHPLYDNIYDPAGAAQKVQDYFASPVADKVRWFFRNYRNWAPTTTVVVSPTTVVVTPQASPAQTGARFCYDSITARDIPADAEIVAGYIDGDYEWSDADWALFPNAVKVRIAALASTNDGHVGDVERGDMTAIESVGWVRMRRAAGADPTIYTSAGQWDAVRQEFQVREVAEPHWWIAHYGAPPIVPDGAVALQYENEPLTGGHYDKSIVSGRWPGVEGEGMTPDEFNKAFDARYSENAEQVNTTKALKDALAALNARLDRLKTI